MVPPHNSEDSSIPAYSCGLDELEDHLKWLTVTLEHGVVEFRTRRSPGDTPGLAGVAIFDSEIDEILSRSRDTARRDVLGLDRAIVHEARLIAARTRVTPGQIELPIRSLATAFHLQPIEVQLCVLAAAPQIDRGYGRVFAYLNNDVMRPYLTPALALGLLTSTWAEQGEVRAALHSASALRRYELLHLESGNGPLEGALSLADGVVRYLLDGFMEPAERGHGAATPKRLILAPSLQSVLDRLVLDQSSHPRPKLVCIHGPRGSGKRTIATALSARLGHEARLLELRPDSTSEQLHRWLRDVRLVGQCPMIRVPRSSDPKLVETVHEALVEWAFPLAFEAHEDSRARGPASRRVEIIRIDIPAPDTLVRAEAWRVFLAEEDVSAGPEDVAIVAAAFPLSVGDISRAATAACARARGVRPDTPSVNGAALCEACRQESEHQLDRLADRVPTNHDWSDLVLPDDQIAHLREFASAVRIRDVVLGRWGFGEKVCTTPGMSALFSGPSGTGKTMAAGILAASLQMALYRVNLSRVVSKYIGETEKHLEALFEEARHVHAILFFDEADAIFGKRSEVKDAHDRYANLEVAYLLQKMEAHDGVTILATNLRKNLDQAFSRRLGFAVEFPHPGEDLRLRIWRGVWPAGATLAPDVDFAFLARQFELAGGHIRNIALTSAYLAAETGAVISMAHLVAATRREYQKFGRVLVDHEFVEVQHLLARSG